MGFNMPGPGPSHLQILQNASQAELLSSGNSAFQKIWISNIKIEAEMKALRYIYLFIYVLNVTKLLFF
jgi:hypothetical protein